MSEELDIPSGTVGTKSKDCLENFISVNKDFEKAIAIAGYSYDPRQDIFVSTLNPWQRNVGYCRLYDEAAAPSGMIIDCEPIYFEYQNEKWMIGFWKGQYDLVTGGEIGLYKEAFDLKIAGTRIGTFYNSVSNNELLEMSFTLKKDGVALLTREGRHWWLTGFKLGEFSEPSELVMEISITLENRVMRDAFVSGLKKTGYSQQEFSVNGDIVNFIFDVPHSSQPISRTKETDKIIQKKNKFLCDRYQDITQNHNNLPDKLRAAEKEAPDLYAKIFNSGKTNYLYEIIAVIIRIGSWFFADVSDKSKIIGLLEHS